MIKLSLANDVIECANGDGSLCHIFHQKTAIKQGADCRNSFEFVRIPAENALF